MASKAVSMMLVTLLAMLASYSPMLKFGYHFVQDRQTKIRRQLFLNGVKTSQYWWANAFYAAMLSAAIQIVIMILALGIFKIDVYQRVNPGVMFVLTVAVVVSSVALSFFMASFIGRTSIYSLMCIVMLVLSVVLIMLSL